jgi:dipeptidyl-peptidase-4
MLPAQEKILTAEDAIYMNRALYPGRIPQLQWIGQSDNYAYAKDNALYRVTAKKGTERLLVELDMLNKGMHQLGLDSLKSLPNIDCYGDENCRFSVNNQYFDYQTNSQTLTKINELPDEAENIDFEKDTRFIAYTLKNNAFIAIDGKSTQITNDTNPGIVNGQTVHRNEFGIHKGLFWSPESKKLAFYRKDETMVSDYPLVDITTRIAQVENTRYPMAGMTSEQVTLGVYHLETGKTVFMQTGEPKEQYLTAVTWGPESKLIYIALLNRDQNHLKVNSYDSETGYFVRTLFEETNPHYVEPENPLYFRPEHNNEFVWVSERGGFDHLYLYNTKGEMIRQLTSGPWVVTGILGFRGDELWFTGTKESPLEDNVYTVEIETGKITRITPDHGTHNAMVSKTGKYVLDIFSSTDVTREYKLLNNTGKEIRVLLPDSNPLADYNLGKMSILTLKADDGTPLYCRIIKPINFDSTKKYPVIVYVYGGPHAQLITDSWLGGAGLFLNYLAEQGYIIWTMDNRGSANRGRDFEQIIHRQVGQVEVNDQMVGVNYLKSLAYVDTTRMGVDGWSYGGFMTISLMLNHPGVFKVAVAGGPVIDWKYYEVMYGERYMDTPQENPEGYEKASLLNNVDQLQGKLMVIHGTKDPTVVWQQSLTFLQAAIEHGKDIDYFVYPGHGHNMSGKDRAHLYEKISRYFNDFLK